MRILLDEGYPSPPGFRPESIDATVEVVSLRSFDRQLTGSQTPDWYLYLRAQEAGFDALVTRDWHQSEQIEELWALSRTDLTVITWRRPIEDPIREWGQLLAYLPEVRRMITENGPSIVFLPSPRLDRKNLEKATGMLGRLAADLSISTQEVRAQARQVIEEELELRGEAHRFDFLTG
ncbi:MAG TPA: hypothetical protein VFU19_07355 [Iamia sp.]|nr:hypothetical protein [Iamia sp.]